MKKIQCNIFSALFLIVLLFSCTQKTPQKTATEIQFISVPGDSTNSLPFSMAVKAGNLLFLSGMLGTVPETNELAQGGIQAETRQVMENIKTVLEQNNSSFDRVIKCTVFLADIGEWSAMNEIYKTYFPNNKPARSALGASGLARGARVEIECIAIVNE